MTSSEFPQDSHHDVTILSVWNSNSLELQRQRNTSTLPTSLPLRSVCFIYQPSVSFYFARYASGMKDGLCAYSLLRECKVYTVNDEMTMIPTHGRRLFVFCSGYGLGWARLVGLVCVG
jgi:hypothetical protein